MFFLKMLCTALWFKPLIATQTETLLLVIESIKLAESISLKEKKKQNDRHICGGTWRNNNTVTQKLSDWSVLPCTAAWSCNTQPRPQGGILPSKRERRLPSNQKWKRARLVASRLQYVLRNGSKMRLKHIRSVGSSLKRHTAWRKFHMLNKQLSLFLS